jgi:hypothetical protein
MSEVSKVSDEEESFLQCCGIPIRRAAMKKINIFHIIGWVFIGISFPIFIAGVCNRPNKRVHDILVLTAIGLLACGGVFAFVIPGILLLIDTQCCCRRRSTGTNRVSPVYEAIPTTSEFSGFSVVYDPPHRREYV